MFKFIKLFMVLVIGMLMLVGSGGSGGGSDDNSTAVHSATEDSPVITLKGNPTVTIIQGTKYTDAGATATDKEDGAVKVTVSGSVDSSKLGTYTITYTAIDKAGNKTTKKRTVKVIAPTPIVDKTAPVITLKGKPTVTIVQGTKYTDAGATAKDNIDGNVKVISSGNVNSSKLGTYTITYTAIDKAGNKATATRKVKVLIL